MSKSANQHLKLFYIADYLREKSDCAHPVTTANIIEMLAANGIKAGRKTVYSDISALTAYGFDIVFRKKKPAGFYLASGKFSLWDLKLLVHAVQISKFIPAEKSEELIDKLCGLISEYSAQTLKCRVYVKDRARAFNESVSSNIDRIQEAVSAQVQLSFLYCEWTLTKELRSERENYRYTVSPHALLWDDEYYQLIAYDHETEKVRNFRVDKIVELKLSEAPCCDRSIFEDVDLEACSKQTFGIFGGRSEKVTLLCKNETAGAVIDRFGKEIIIIKETNSMFKVSVNVTVSPNFFGWIASFGGDVTISAPSNTAEEYKAFLKKVLGSAL